MEILRKAEHLFGNFPGDAAIGGCEEIAVRSAGNDILERKHLHTAKIRDLGKKRILRAPDIELRESIGVSQKNDDTDYLPFHIVPVGANNINSPRFSLLHASQPGFILSVIARKERSD